ncbi:MAG: tetratricopeptide repeat protein [Deltaproteobacteria bacterium]|nr:tetratricopeptide repeat protein [Deltaproteobacteria bacterium]
MPMNLRQKLQAALTICMLTAATIAVYWPCLEGPFFFDDEHFIQKNSLVQDLANWPKLYTSTVTQGANIKGNFYRPNQQMVYALLYARFGQSTTLPYHLVPLLLHLGSGMMLLMWLRRLGLSLVGAGLGAGVFLLHPVQTEAVCYISGLSDPLATFFIMTAILLMTPIDLGDKRSSTRPWAVGAKVIALMLVVSLAMLSKESGVVLAPILLFLILYFCLIEKRRPRADELAALAVVGVLAAASVVAKFTLFKFGDAIGLTDAANPYTQSLVLRLTTFVSVIWDYMTLLIWPRHLFYEKPYTAYAGLLHARGLFGLGLIIVGAVASLLARRRPLVALGVTFVASAMLPFSGIVPLNAMFLEHWLYTAMIGISLLIGLAADWAWRRRQVLSIGITAGAMGLGLLSLASARTWARTAEWADVEAFYLNEIAHAHNPGRIYNNLGMYYADQGDPGRAIKYYELAAQSDTGKMFAQPHHNLAMAYFHAGQNEQALRALHQALKVDPQFIFSLRVLHSYFKQKGDDMRASTVGTALKSVETSTAYDFAQLERDVF